MQPLHMGGAAMEKLAATRVLLEKARERRDVLMMQVKEAQDQLFKTTEEDGMNFDRKFRRAARVHAHAR